MAETMSFMRNKYWVLRHGRSIPNEKGFIVSSMENGIRPDYQLAPLGVNQAQIAGELFNKLLVESCIPLADVRICYSPFSRTTQTARIVASVLNIQFDGPQCKVMETLHERFFGPSFELGSSDAYNEIYGTLDAIDPLMRPGGGESVDDVASRLADAMVTMESLFQGCTILVVGHGDPLQILQAILNAIKLNTYSSYDLALRIKNARAPSILSQHRKLNLRNGELRAVI
ncbi:uncharacterized protein LOC126803250 [Argentina anserina]|uniref:uncharacterized protein LOC126803250 n=1 Tax=Argentina anserina TaxID=57926 RepID=UPI00217625F3|nr:uncharacterized protein LOC126803250 [Potentilla anserina]